jgi:periplasmic protein TonB
MAPFAKEPESTLVGNPSATPAAKAPADAANRTQPVAMEIPVTINGARSVAGSDKREPFSENTQTVLVFGHGAVVRVSTLLAAGQLIFLTNEKTKKEVVCQVAKSKSGGSSGNYVELQFTEPAPGFWGLPAGASAPAPRPVSTLPQTAPPKPVAPAPPAAKPVAPVAIAPKVAPAPIAPPPEPPKLVVPPPPPAPPAKPVLVAAPPAPVASAPLVSAPSPLSLDEIVASLAPPPPSQVPPVTKLLASLAAEKTPVPAAPPVHDYTKEIDALFAVPSAPSRPAPAAPEAKSAQPSSDSEELRLEAARLQAQLSSLLFTGPPNAKETAVSGAPKTQPPAEFASKVIEIAPEQPKSAVAEPKLPAHKLVPALSAEEEVKIPSWLAPLSQNSEPAAAESPISDVVNADSEVASLLEESSNASAGSQRPETAVFGGQLLGEGPAEKPGSGSNKGLWIGLVAAALLLAGGGAYYFKPGLFGMASQTSPLAAKPAVSTPAQTSAASTPFANVDTKPSPPQTANPKPAPAPAPIPATPAAAQPSKNPEPLPSSAVYAPGREARNSNKVVRSAPEPEAAKPGLGEVHLGAPIVHGADAPQGGDAPSIETSSNAGGNALNAVAANRSGPAAPIGGDVTPAQLLKSVPPVYPALAKSQHISGKVQLDAFINEDGNVADVKVISGSALLHKAAQDAVKQWKYKPALLDGQPTTMHLTVTVQFTAPQ